MSVEFAVNERCVCIYKNVAFEAKVVKIKEIRGVRNFIIHYPGWSRKMDEKIPIGSERLIKGTLEEYRQNHPEVKTGDTLAVLNENRRKRKVEENPEEEAPEVAPATSSPQIKRVNVSIEWPKEMRTIAVFDKLVAEEAPEKMIVRLMTEGRRLDDIVKMYQNFLGVTEDQMEETENQILSYNPDGVTLSNLSLAHSAYELSVLFNAIFSFQLLRPEEKDQFGRLFLKFAVEKQLPFEVIQKNPVESGFFASAHYGIVHFLRMVSKLDEIVAAGVLKTHHKIGVNNLMEFLENNHEQFFDVKTDYIPINGQTVGENAEENDGEGTSTAVL